MAQADDGVPDCCVWLSFPASDRMRGRSRQRHTNQAFDGQFGSMGAEPAEDVQEKSEQVHVAPLALTEK